MKKKIILIAGDPNSINTEILFKVWNKVNKNLRRRLYIIGNYQLIDHQKKALGFKHKLQKVHNIFNKNSDEIKIIDVSFNFKKAFNVNKKECSKYILKSLDLAHFFALNKKYVSGIINCPIDKRLLGSKKKIGVTEYLAEKNKVKINTENMMIYHKKLAVVPLTTHIDIRDVPKKLSKSLIFTKIFSLEKNYQKIFKKKPNIALLGLNPHNSELRKNSEEVRIIIPAIKMLKKNCIKIVGPLSSDTLFIKDYKKFDIIVGMYHDQVLIPMKSLFKFDAINITLGLNYLRTSPDHGTAKELIMKNKATPLSLLRCIEFLNR